MKVGSVGLESVAGSMGVGRTAPATEAAAARDRSAERGATISQPAELLSKLGDLSQKDPAKFGEVAGAVASGLKDAAAKANGDDATKLSQLSEDIARASKAQDLSAARGKRAKARPKGKLRVHGPGSPHPGAAPSAAVKGAVQVAIDKVDAALASSSTTASTGKVTGAS